MKHVDEIDEPRGDSPDPSWLSYNEQVLIARRLREGICPNGCGPMVRDGESAVCPHCGCEWAAAGDSVLTLLDVAA